MQNRPETSRADLPANDGLASWYTPGVADGFGDRLLMSDNSGADSLELLRFHHALASVAGFEGALRERVSLVGRLSDPALSGIIAVERLDGALALVSTHTPGKRLSAFFNKPTQRRGLNSAVVGAVVTQVLRVLTVLQAKGADVAHGAISPDRVVITPSGQICVLEHVLGSAIERLGMSAPQLWRQFGLIAPPSPSGNLRLDARSDVFQLAVVALELLLGRRFRWIELADRTSSLLDQWSSAAKDGPTSIWLREWLERALQLSSGAYENATEAYADLRSKPWESTLSAFESLASGNASGTQTLALPPAEPKDRSVVVSVVGADVEAAGAAAAEAVDDVPSQGEPAAVVEHSPRRIERPSPTAWAEQSSQLETSPPSSSLANDTEADEPPTQAVPLPRRTFDSRHLWPWITAALGMAVVVEGWALSALLRRPTPVPATLGVAAAQPSVATMAAPLGVPVTPVETVAAGRVPTRQAPDDVLSGIEAAARRQRQGGVRFRSPVELKVLQGESVLGSTSDGPIVAPAGTHQLDFINTALGVRLRRAVTFLSGEISNVEVVIPPVRINVNARPWAEVIIDNRLVGETPLANIEVTVGEHEVVFRHPEFGERRQVVTVRPDVPTRLTMSFDR